MCVCVCVCVCVCRAVLVRVVSSGSASKFAMLCMNMFVNFCMFRMPVYVRLICIIIGICALYVFL